MCSIRGNGVSFTQAEGRGSEAPVRTGERIRTSVMPAWRYTNSMAKRQTTGSEIDAVEWLRGLPKCELHLHLEGTILPDTLLELSKRHDEKPLTAEEAKKLYVYGNFSEFMDSIKAVSSRLKGPDDYELITYNMVRELAQQGVVHAEVYVSFGIIFYWKNAAVEPFMEAIERGRVRAEKDFGTTVFWLIDAVRHFGAEEGVKVFRKAAELRERYPSIVGIGIGGDEARGGADLFARLTRRRRQRGCG